MAGENGSASALDDVRVLDLAGEQGAYATKLLADLGADVIRVEPPGGDPVRRRAPFVHDEPGPERSLLHLFLNTSKRGVTLDLETADGRDLFRRLVATADVLVETFSPGYLDRLGLGYEGLRRVRPDLIQTSITGFGLSGPHAEWQSSDLVAVAMSGILTLSGYVDRPPHRPVPSQAFYSGGIEGAIGTLMALTHRDIHGEGQFVEVSLQESLSNAQETAMQFWDLQKRLRTRTAGSDLGTRYGGLIECADGYVYAMVGLISRGASLADLVRWMDQEGKAEDLVTSGVLAALDEAASRRRATPASQSQLLEDQALVARVMEPVRRFFKTKRKHDLYVEGQRRGFLIGPANDPRDIVESEQLNSRDWFITVPHPELGLEPRFPGAPFRLADSPSYPRRRAPLLGEHNTQVYRDELGLSDEQLATLRATGAI